MQSMKNFTAFIIFLLVILVLIVGGVLLFANSGKIATVSKIIPPTQITPAQPKAAATILITTNPTNGQYLTDSTGRTLYRFTKDTATKNNCTGACAALWPVFYFGVVVYPPLNTADFRVITTGTGASQITYKGQPLYYYAKDTKPGDTLGNGIGGVWFLVKP